MKTLHIFRAGRHTDSRGQTLDFSEELLRASAAAYDPAKHEAPIVVGHPRNNSPAYGWVKRLGFDGANVEAEPHQVEAEFSELVAAGRFKKISASWYLPDAPANPVPGTLYLRHVGFLGAQPPAIKGLRAPEFAENEPGVVELMEPWDTAGIAGVFRRLREWFLDKFDAETADRVLPSFVIEDLEASARRGEEKETEPDPAPSFTEPPQKESPMSDTPQESAPAAEFAEREHALSAKEAAIAAREAAIARAEIEREIDALVNTGQVLPKDRAGVVAFMAGLDEAEQTVEFGEGDKAVKLSPRAWLKQFLAGLPKLVDYSEAAPAAPPADDNDPVALAARITEYREAQQHKGRSLSYTQAAAELAKTP